MTEIDDRAVMKTLRNLERNLTSGQHKRAVARAARPAGNYLKGVLRSMMPEGENAPFEHVSLLKRALKVTSAKTWRKYPGVNVMFKGGDVDVGQGITRRSWELADYAYLVLFGNHMTPNRPTRSGGKSRGNVDGIAPDNIFRIVEKQYGAKALDMFANDLIKEVNKEIAKSVVNG